MGCYVVSPATHPTACGRFRASFSLQRMRADGSPDRTFQFDTTSTSRHAARVFAVTQGWLQTSRRTP